MIILDARYVKAYEALHQIGEAAGFQREYLEELWSELGPDQELFGEFVYYLEHHSFFDMVRCSGYSLTDLYFYLFRRYEVSHDIGKNFADCDKEALVLESFMMMAKMKKDPDPYIRRLEKDPGMDLL